MGPSRAFLLLLPLALPVAAAFAQAGAQVSPHSHDEKAAAMIAQQREMVRAATAPPRCIPRSSADEIVVCATDGSKYRVSSNGELDTTSRAALRDGLVRPPDVGAKMPSGIGIAGCFLGPCPPPTMYMIDLTTIPEAPPGSDADKVGKGEMRDR